MASALFARQGTYPAGPIPPLNLLGCASISAGAGNTLAQAPIVVHNQRGLPECGPGATAHFARQSDSVVLCC